MQQTLTTWGQFRQHWGGVHNFLMAGDIAPFKFELPPLPELVDILRQDPAVRVLSGVKSAAFDMTNITEEFRKIPIADALQRPFNLAHFKLGNFSVKGQVFEKLEESWVEPWRRSLTAHGFTWTELFPIVFVAGRGCATNYHMDASHVLAWQRCGIKYFNSLREPDRWTTRAERATCVLEGSVRPVAIGPEDIVTHVMPAGTVLWNTIATPHWVDASAEVAATLSLVHRGLRMDGQLCPHEVEMEEYRKEQAGKGKATAASGRY